MAKLHEIVESLRAELSGHFQTVRVSSVQTPEQFTKELKALNPEKLPGVVIVFDNLSLISEEAVEECHLTLVVVDKFVAGSDEKALSVFRAGSDLMDLFPKDGRTLGGVFIHPTDCVAASPDAQYAALALGITCKQGF